MTDYIAKALDDGGGSFTGTHHELMTVKEAAVYLRMPVPTVYYGIKRGNIPALRIGGRWRLSRQTLDQKVLFTDYQGYHASVLAVVNSYERYRDFHSYLRAFWIPGIVARSEAEAIRHARTQQFDVLFVETGEWSSDWSKFVHAFQESHPESSIVVVVNNSISQLPLSLVKNGALILVSFPLDSLKLIKLFRQLGKWSGILIQR